MLNQVDAPAQFVTVTGLAPRGWCCGYPRGVQAVAITVKGGYSPVVSEVVRGRPVQLSFYRNEENGCSAEQLLPDFSIRRYLPTF